MTTKNHAFTPIAAPLQTNQPAGKGGDPSSSTAKIAVDVRVTTTEKAGAKKWFPVVEGTSFRAEPSESAEAAIRQIERNLGEKADSIYELPRSGSQHKSLASALAELRTLNIEE